MGEEEDEDDPSASMIRKVAVPLLQKAIPWVVAAIVGAIGGGATHQVEDANHDATIEASRAKALQTEHELATLKEGLGQVLNALNEEANKREEHIRDLERQIVWMQGRLNLVPPAEAPRR